MCGHPKLFDTDGELTISNEELADALRCNLH
jgi:hypothetical protein